MAEPSRSSWDPPAYASDDDPWPMGVSSSEEESELSTESCDSDVETDNIMFYFRVHENNNFLTSFIYLNK